ncbi:MAG: GatB/YqeY domain-containing protein [Nitrospiraceae bacterium]|nr:GatB/YqeY domain-containing protein [Nitrospiraceae bacterium]
MPLAEQIDADLKGALKAGEKLRLETLRMLKSALKYKQIEKGGQLADEDVVSIIGSLSKQRRESVEQFRKAGREDLARKEEQEIDILKVYLPRQLTPEELDAIVSGAVRESGAQGMKDMGKVMRLIMPKTKGAADGKLVNGKVKEALSALEGKK